VTDAVCPLCGTTSKAVFVVDGYPIQECGSCKHRFVDMADPGDHIAKVYGDSYFVGGGAGYPDYLSEADLLRRHGQRYARMLRQQGVDAGEVLDVGAAAGFVLQGFIDEGWRGMGVEPNPAMAGHGRDVLGLDIVTGPLETVAPSRQFDLVNMIQVVAHFYDLKGALCHASDVTRPGGHWLIETWNRDSATARLFGCRWHEYSPPSVLRWFSPGDLGRYVKHFGFSEVARGRPVKRLNGAHAKSLLRFKLGTGPSARLPSRLLELIPDRLEIPYPSEDLFWALYRMDG
jgi:SAM-dependent methyltransferase